MSEAEDKTNEFDAQGESGESPLRVACYFLCVLQFVFLILSVYLAWRAFGPDPGDNMILMGLPVIGIVATPTGLALLGIVLWKGHLMKRWDR